MKCQVEGNHEGPTLPGAKRGGTKATAGRVRQPLGRLQPSLLSLLDTCRELEHALRRTVHPTARPSRNTGVIRRALEAYKCDLRERAQVRCRSQPMTRPLIHPILTNTATPLPRDIRPTTPMELRTGLTD